MPKSRCEASRQMPFHFQRLELPEVILIEPIVLEDERGSFTESYKYSDFVRFGIASPFVQDNHSRSLKGVLRGLHYQKKAKAQGKLVRVLQGEILDVAVDIRRNSHTYGKWVEVKLSGKNAAMLYVPTGFAHGFCVLSDVADILYKLTEEYAPDQERGIAWNDPDLCIPWPVGKPILSLRDAGLPPLRDADNDF